MSDFVCPEGARLIPLGSKKRPGLFAIVDAEDYEYLSQFTWHIYTTGYAYRAIKKTGQAQENVAMHREIMAAGPGTIIDHKNRVPLDNRRSNLRFCTIKENVMNRTTKKGVCGYHGVTKARGGYYCSRCGGARLGYYATAIEAAIAYDIEARKEYGTLIPLNFPEAIFTESPQRLQKAQNAPKSPSGYRGVRFHEGRIVAVFRRKYLGSFASTLEAAIVYDAAARAAGAMHLLNFPD